MASTSRPAGSSSGAAGGPPGLVASFVQSPKLVIATVAVTSSLATAGVLLATQRLSRKARRTDLEDSARRATGARLRPEKHGAGRSTEIGGAAEEASTDGGTPRYLTNLAGSHHDFAPHLRPSPLRRSQSNQPYDESLVREQLARHYSFLGDEGMEKLRGAFVVVVGAGGVGSTCALSLLRAGVGAIRLIDFDQVSLSSLNRHAVATLADVGRPKVVVCSEHFARIAPWAHIEAWVELFKGDEAPRLLGASRPVGRSADAKTRQPTYVVDAIDNLDTKVELLAYCYRQGIKCFSSMGAGAKSDPSRIQIADLSDTSEDPLSRHVRRKLRFMGIPSLGPDREERKKKRESLAPEPAQVAVRKSILQGKDEVKPFEIPSRITLPKNESKGRAPLVASPLASGAAATSPRPPPPSAWANASSTGNRHMRRASSASSMGSAAYHTPLGTPMLPSEGSDDGRDADDTVRLPEAALADEEEDDASSPMPSLALPQAEHRDSLVEMSASPLPSPSPQNSSLGPAKERNPLSRAASTAKLLAGQDPSDSEARPARSKSKSKNSEEPEGGRLGIPVVFSTETKSDIRLLPLPEEEYQRGNVEELAVLNDFRVRVLPVLGPIPAMFGFAAATYVMCDIAGRPQEPFSNKPARKFYEKIWNDLEAVERRFPAPGSGRIARDPIGPRFNTLSTNDCAYIYDEVFHQRSIVPPFDTPTRPALLRWDSTIPLSLSNVAVFSKTQAKRHEDEVLARGRSPFEVWGNEAGAMFKRRMAEERRMSLMR